MRDRGPDIPYEQEFLHMTFRNLTLLTATAVLAVATLSVVQPRHDGSVAIDTQRVARHHDKGLVKESPHWMKWYQIQRTYGNPDVNIGERLQAVYSMLQTSNQSSFSKKNETSSNAWTSLGPVNISGRIRAIAMSAAQPNTIYAGAASGGVWKSTDMGMSWVSTSDFMNTLAIGALAIDPNNPNRIFAGTGEPVVYAGVGAPQYYGTGLMRSDDAGATWTRLPWPSASTAVHRIAIHPTSADTMIVASIGDLYKTTDGGQTWRRTMSGLATDVYYAPGRPSRVYAAMGNDEGATANGVYVSDAGGERFSWRRLSTNFPTADSCGRIVLAISQSDPNRLYAAVAMSNARKASFEEDFYLVMMSTNGGESWTRRYNAISRAFTNGQAFYDLALGVMPNNPDFVMLGGIDWYRSTNGGASFSINTDWKLRTTNPGSARYAHADQHAILFHPTDPNTILIGCDGGIHITTNSGLQWQIRSTNMVNTQFYSCAYNPSNPAVIYGGTQDQSNMRMSAPNSMTWNYMGGGDGGNIVVDPQNSSLIYILINMAPYRTTDGGATFTKIDNGFDTYERFGWQPPYLMHPTSRTTLFTGGHRMYKAVNAHQGTPTWALISPDLTKAMSGITSRLSDAAIAPSNPDWMYTVSGDGRAMVSSNYNKSTDPTWTDISSGLPNRYLADVFVDWEDHLTVYVAVSGFNSAHVFKTTNGGSNWTDISGNLPDVPVNAVVRSRTDANTIFAATDVGVWVTRDGGTSWEQYGSGLPNVVVWDLAITPENVLIAGTHGRGMWSVSSILSAEGTRGDVTSPAQFTLFQNYPNPFNPTTTISFTLARRSTVALEVYDTRGVRVRSIATGMHDAGTHRVQFDASSLPAGVYLYTLEVNGMRQVRKMSLVK